ncbi:MAG: RNA polymerase sigma factor [Chloroflexi bacterium]|nr:RNA polymerase sigma factor [Chloroflexota bacterium]
MKMDRQEFMEEVNRALEAVAQKHGVLFANQIRPIVEANRVKERLDHFLEGDSTKTISDYVWLIVEGYLKWHDCVFQIQQVRSDDVWELLAVKIEQWAYHFLVRKGLHPGKETQKIAQDYASEAAVAILQAHFTYDTDLDAWLQQIVIYTCCNQTEIWKRQQELEKKLAQALKNERPLKTGGDGIEHHVSSQEEADVLNQAIQQLKNPKMRQVVWLRYYGELSSQEIAQAIGSSYRYVDKLHWQAKHKLGKILGG